MPHRRFAALISLACLLFAGCGDEMLGEQGAARLVVREELPAEPRYMEGSLSFLRLQATGSSDVVVDGPMTTGQQARGKEPLLDTNLEPGEYRLVSYQRPCQGNCDRLEPPTDRCRTTLRLEPKESLTATIVLADDGGCTIRWKGTP